MKKKAILYTSNFEKLATLAQYLVHDNWEILSAGKTASFLEDNNIPYTLTKQLEGNANSDDGFLILAHMILASGRNLLSSSIYTESVVSLVCMNVQPWMRKVDDFREIENTDNCFDLKGTTLLLSAAKNYMNVVTLCDPLDYQEAIIQLKTESMTSDYRLYLASKAMNQVAAYNASTSMSILSELAPHTPPRYALLPYKFEGMLAHGINNQQKGLLFSLNNQKGALSGMRKIQGKEMNWALYENCMAAWKTISLFTTVLKNSFTVESFDVNDYPFTTQFTPASGSVFTIAIKNTNPVGAALGDSLITSFRKSYSCDEEAFAGATLGCSSIVDAEAAREFVKIDFRAIIAPDYTAEAKEILSEREDMRLVIASKHASNLHDFSVIDGGLLVQTLDKTFFEKLKVVTEKRPSQQQMDAMAFGIMLAMVAKSDSAIVVNDFAAIGISVGNTSRRRAVRYALDEAMSYFRKNADNNLISHDQNSEILVSDSVINFDEFTKNVANAGVKAILQTGGSDTDAEFIQYCNEHDIAMVFTGIQHLAI